MFPGMDKRAVEAAMKKLGVQQEQLDAKEVVIRLNDGHELVIPNPSVALVRMMGQETFQISGQYSERESQPQHQLFNNDDVKMVISQTGASETEAKAALAKTNGDIAAAIMLITDKKE